MMTLRQRDALETAKAAQGLRDRGERELAKAVRVAVKLDVPLLTLSRELGVSRTRIRTLARSTPDS